MKPLILCDFDGTISLRDMGYTIVSQFCNGDWKAIDQDFRDGKIGSKEAYSRIAKILIRDEHTITQFIRDHSDIDPHFLSFYQTCQRLGIHVKVVSDGLDFYIRTILGLHHLSDIPFYANAGQFREGEEVNISFPYWNDECGHCGTCKKRLVQIHRDAYDPIFFIGNGFSDRCGAREADFVFAKDSLYTYCTGQDIPCNFYQNFHDILNDLTKESIIEKIYSKKIFITLMGRQQP